MSDLLSIGASGVRAYQTALTTVSENIANTGVEGYSRRITNLREVQVTGSRMTAAMTNGMGVQAAGITRAGDGYAQEAVRGATADLSRTDANVRWLSEVEGALTGEKLGERVTAFYASGRALAAEPASSSLRVGMLDAAESAAAAFAATGRALDQVAADLDSNAEQMARDLTDLGGTLAKINLGLGRTQPGSAAAAQLADQRDQTLERMSGILDVSASFDQFGRATVRLGGRNGSVLVDPAGSGQVTYARSGGAVALTLSYAGEGGILTPNGGALAGVADAAQRFNDSRNQLNALATRFATGVNDVQAAGENLDGLPGGPIFAIGLPGSELDIVLDDPRGIAAAAVAGGPRDGSNLEGFEAMRTSSGPEAGAIALVTDNASALRQRKAISEAQGAIRDGTVTSRASLSGVDLDNEAVDLLRFQQAYQASSRVIQVAREAFQSILDIR